MVSPDSQRVLRARQYLSTTQTVSLVSITGLSPSMVGLSMRVYLPNEFCNCVEAAAAPPVWLTTPSAQPRQGITRSGFGLFPVRSPLLRESFPFLGVLRCFSSPTCLRIIAVPTHYGRRVAPFGNLRIGLQAAPRSLSQRNHVLHRPWLPRHPPYALIRLKSYLASHLCTLCYCS